MRYAFFALLASLVLSAAAQTCLVCGEIRAIREVSAGGALREPGPVPGNVGTASDLHTGPVVGSVAQFRFDAAGRGGDWSFGAAGTPEMQARLGETYYELTVVMDAGEKRTLQRKDGNRFHVGQRVALRSGELEPM